MSSNTIMALQEQTVILSTETQTMYALKIKKTEKGLTNYHLTYELTWVFCFCDVVQQARQQVST